jgi:hypothetical protein
MEAGERELFEKGVRRATDTRTGAALDQALAGLGWLDALRADRATAVSVLFEAQGGANATSSALDRLLAGALDPDGRVDQADVAVVLPPLRSVAAPGTRQGKGRLVHGLGTQALTRSDRAVVVAASGGRQSASVVQTSALELRTVRGIDPASGIVVVAGELSAASAEEAGPVDWGAAVALGQLALGHELVGTARAMLELARQHALERMQFGRPIGSFQAVRHRLADCLVAIEAAAALLVAAWDDPSPAVAAMAKGLAGRGARTVARHCQQVLAGIGFTTEHPLHRYVRRTILLDQLLGAGTGLTRRLGADLLATGSPPPAFPL